MGGKPSKQHVVEDVVAREAEDIARKEAMLRGMVSEDGTSMVVRDIPADVCTRDGIEALRRVLADGLALEKVVIEGCNIGVVGARMIARLLLDVGWIELSLARNHLGVEGTTVLAEVLKGNSVLEVLSLAGNSVGLAGASALASLLESNRSLRVLDLGETDLREEGMAVLAPVLAQNRSIESLDLSKNDIGNDAGVHAVADIILGNTTLTSMSLASNSIKRTGCLVLLEALRQNHSLTSVDMAGNAKTDGGAELLADHLKVNATLGDSLF
ncbi:NOD3 protein [Thecamonas trahens ATCC 50062]|uniref:NOD3 protein n=1 Tax=Thecamonas trahens ATCC 50062 TaxID=461836 RepID=A0A0L0DM68_THETB|nr:NOD3 protein [Thecamonas trahens ATCC 50062]KNC53116.1 NOD3 protein [Thecamonas trahens ATCC 50062]|eukprot:XP_013754783.1 NOD3 protein [Thecamonas trahens ATCC 50062]